MFSGLLRANGENWLHQNFFNVTCVNGKIKVVNCVSVSGTQIPLGTFNYFEDGVYYSCRMNFNEDLEEANNTLPVPECDFLPANGRSEFVRGLFVASCINDEIIGCIDIYGDLVRSGQLFVYTQGQLRRCIIYGRGRWAKTERLGCFNGSREDDPENKLYHVPLGRKWINGNFELRCTDNGIIIYKCLVDGQRIHEGTAWIDKDGVLNVCE
ncbi:hypothetical protein ACQ4LE_009805 [Meloidogyne hapla]